MTIQEAKKAGQCNGCAWATVGPGQSECMGSELGDVECPGRASRGEIQRRGEGE